MLILEVLLCRIMLFHTADAWNKVRVKTMNNRYTTNKLLVPSRYIISPTSTQQQPWPMRHARNIISTINHPTEPVTTIVFFSHRQPAGQSTRPNSIQAPLLQIQDLIIPSPAGNHHCIPQQPIEIYHFRLYMRLCSVHPITPE